MGGLDKIPNLVSLVPKLMCFTLHCMVYKSLASFFVSFVCTNYSRFDHTHLCIIHFLQISPFQRSIGWAAELVKGIPHILLICLFPPHLQTYLPAGVQYMLIISIHQNSKNVLGNEYYADEFWRKKPFLNIILRIKIENHHLSYCPSWALTASYAFFFFLLILRVKSNLSWWSTFLKLLV